MSGVCSCRCCFSFLFGRCVCGLPFMPRVWVAMFFCFFFSSRRRHTRFSRDWSSDVCSSDLLVTGSSERAFWRYLLLRGKQGPRQALAFLLFMARYLPIGGIHTPRKNKAYLSGLRVEEVEALAREFVAEKLVHRLYEPVVQRLKQHQNRGDIVVLMSGTLYPIARALADHLGVGYVCATLLSQRN